MEVLSAEGMAGVLLGEIAWATAARADEKLRRDVVRRVRAAIAELNRAADQAEAELIRLRVEAGRLQKWLAREGVAPAAGAAAPAVGPRAA
jgi:hypothetical protein